MSSLSLPFDGDAARIDARDRAARERAVNPRFNVALEASAGTGKTRVLVERYLNLLRAGVEPANVLAMTFTRKAATEMRERILQGLRDLALRGDITPSRSRELEERSGDISISTIDAFCLSLLREFPLEADLDPGFSVADDTEVPRLVDESLDRALRTCRALAREDEQVALVFAQLGERRARIGLAALLARRVVAPDILARFLSRNRRDQTVAGAATAAARALLGLFAAMGSPSDDPNEGLRAFVISGPSDPAFMLFVSELESVSHDLTAGRAPDPRRVYAAFARAREYFLTRSGEPRARLAHPKSAFASDALWRSHRRLVTAHAPGFVTVQRAYRHDLNVIVASGVWRMFRIAEREYRRTLDAHAVLDFSDLLLRTLVLLRRMEEFARSRYRLESRYHHVLVDEFQDTSRAQWELMALLVESWGEGAGLAHAGPLPPSIFIVGDRKQSIYGFRDADVSVLGDAVQFLQGLRPDRDVRRSISRSFRSVPALLAFVNDVCRDMDKVTGRPDAFAYGEDDQFPVDDAAVGETATGDGLLESDRRGQMALGVVVGESQEACAESVAEEIATLLATRAPIRDSSTGARRDIRAGDIAILFRTRESHRTFEQALERRDIPSYVYKGLGFFETDEIRDVLALLGFLAEPSSNLRAAALLRSGVVGLSDRALGRLAPEIAAALTEPTPPSALTELDGLDARSLELARESCRRWLAQVDIVAPAELLDRVLSESAYAAELRGPRHRQAYENLKKIRDLVRRAQNRGYATLGRIVNHLDRLAVGDEANAAIDATEAVTLMTVHAAKGLEFPAVFVVDLTRGTGTRRPPIRVAALGADDVSVSVGDYRSATDEDEAAQEREETKRLLYVALTRARDRLYLSAVVEDARMLPGRGSLAEVLPASLLTQLAAASGDDMSWTGSAGARHRFRIVPPHTTTGNSDTSRLNVCTNAGVSGDTGAASADATDVPGDFAPLAPSRIADDDEAAAGARAVEQPAIAERLVGTLVHRLVQRFGLAEAQRATDVPTGAMVRQLMRPEELGVVSDLDQIVHTASGLYRRLCERDDVRSLFEGAEVLYEVPFCLAAEDGAARGVIDCLIVRQHAPAESHAGIRRAVSEVSTQVDVLELKTGQRRPEHHQQADVYRRAAEAIFPGLPVGAWLVYPEHLVRC